MSSERLYYTDAYLTEFDAVVRDVRKQDDRWIVTLDRTAFYPTSGGQPFDVGWLGDARVVDVVDRADGGIGHITDRALDTDLSVRGRVDWVRRFDHMQQHTGQHLLSAAFEREVGAKTVSFHLGTGSATIDLDRDVSAEQASSVEEVANRILWEDRDVRVRTVTPQEAATLPLRKDPTRSGDLRIVEIEGYDLSACGGTHVGRTGGIGMVVIAGSERFKGGARVEFMCGHRALRAHRSLRTSVSGSVRLLSVLPDDLPAAIERLQSSYRDLQKSEEANLEELARHEAAALVRAGTTLRGTTVVVAAVSCRDATGLKRLASITTAGPGVVAVITSSISPTLVVVARSQDLTIDSGAILKNLIERFGGKGGGRGAMAQGGGLTGDTQEILEAARSQIEGLTASIE